MTAAPMRRGSLIGLSLFTLVVVAVLLSLGVWQLQRRVEKHALIAALTERLANAPVALPPPGEWLALNPAQDEFRRVRFTATFQPVPDAMVYSPGSAIRQDVSGPGTWAFLPAQLAGGDIVVVNAGFVPNTMMDRAQQDRAARPLITGDPVAMTGYLRFSELPGALTTAPNADKRLWFTRDHQAMAQQLGWGESGHSLAPFYVDLESPEPPSGVPKPGPLGVKLKDNHLQYAITWFGLAAAVGFAFAIWLFGQRRRASPSP